MMGFLDRWLELGHQPQYNSHCTVKCILFFWGYFGKLKCQDIADDSFTIQQKGKRRLKIVADILTLSEN